jgi:glycosyltransferase involved in cell wall biosynthesis
VAEVDAGEVNRALEKFGLRDRLFLLHVGTLQPRKNLRRLVAAWARAERPREARLVLAGAPGWGGDANQLQSDAAALGVAESVRVLGYVSDVEKAARLRSARGYIFPSLHEGFGFPVLEAQSAGLPVACSDTSSLPEVAGDAALLFDPLSTEQIAAAIGQLLADDLVRSALIERGWRNLGRFSWDNCARAVLGALEG